MTPCSLTEAQRPFDSTNCLHFQDKGASRVINSGMQTVSRVPCLLLADGNSVQSSTLKTEVTCFSETSVSFYLATWSRIQACTWSLVLVEGAEYASTRNIHGPKRNDTKCRQAGISEFMLSCKYYREARLCYIT
jgi:hypothetical protein